MTTRVKCGATDVQFINQLNWTWNSAIVYPDQLNHDYPTVMPGTLATKADQNLAEEARIQVALQAVICSGLGSTGKPLLSLRSAAKNFDVSRSKLTARWNGRGTRAEAHATQQKLSSAQEEVLTNWIKSLARRGIPLSPSAVAEYASTILGEPVSEHWVRKFRTRHGDLKARWTTGLESCRAKSLNRTQVSDFFNILEELITQYDIVPSNMYNMDEKGIQLGIGKRTLVLVDRDQKTVQQVEDGSRELVTVIETVCADGTALRPCVIFKAKRRDLEWGRHNPCDAR